MRGAKFTAVTLASVVVTIALSRYFISPLALKLALTAVTSPPVYISKIPSQLVLDPETKAVPSTDRKSVRKRCKGATKSLLSWRPSGRLGNQICQYVHLLVLNSTYSVHVEMDSKMADTLQNMFLNLSVKPLSNSCQAELARRVRPTPYAEAAQALQAGLEEAVAVSGTPCDLDTMWPARARWQKDLVIAPALKSRAADRLSEMVIKWSASRPQSQSNPTLVGAHVRRGDIKTVLRGHHFGNEQLLRAPYYRAAFSYYRTRFTNALFVVVTDRMEYTWCRDHLVNGAHDVILADDKSGAVDDMALLASFEHFIYSHGTYGLWGILLSSPKTVAYPHPDMDFKRNRYSIYKSFDKIRLTDNDTEYIQLKYGE